ncbi:MAG: hypothetical protein ABJF10_07975 [Chthoniobacter sp.]|uniref:hypothetical protein n=1 Tax=Chthoniobacter sp. TaxID=2510640 RepID=UPI0032A5E347
MSSASSSWFRIFAVLLAVTASATLHATTLVIEAGQLELPGGWETITTPRNEFARKYILAGPHAKGAPAAGAIDLPHAGQWRLWVRSKDFAADRPGARNFTVRLGNVRSPTIFGRHGRTENDGWAWEDGGTLDLPAGPTLVAIGDESTSSARCDSLVLTDNPTYRPEGVPWKLAKSAATYLPLTIDEKSKRAFQPAPFTSVKDTPLATLQNDRVHFSFHEATTASGPAIALRAATRDGDRWIPIEGSGSEGYRVLFRPKESDPKIVCTRVHPTWDTTFSPVVEASCAGAKVTSRLGIATAPWASAKCFALHPSGAHQRDAQTVDLDFPETPQGRLKATWHLSAQQPAAQIELHFQPKELGHFSLGYHAPLSCAPGDADFLLLPFMYEGKRFPAEPSVVLSALTPTPLALVNRAGVSCALVGDPRDIPFEWPTSQNSRYAFALRNESGAAQPLIYLPVLGQPGSASDGGAIHVRFRLWLQRGEWYAAYHRIAEEIFALQDYRRPVTASLSDAALNIVDLMRNEEAAGWHARAKGPWNIESRNTVTQSSPLAYLSIYLLTGDEDFYNRFARPSLEYLLSRPGPHFAAEHEIWDNYYHHQPLRGPGTMFGASTFASAYAMTQGHSPVFGALCLDEKGAPRTMHANGHTQPFADALALYKLTGERHWLDSAIAAADKYIAANITTLPTRDLGGSPFVNVSFVPDWEGLLQIYEATGEKRFLDASIEGAHWLMTTLWTQPTIPMGNTTIHPGGIYDINRHIWWFGDKLFRRGLYDAPATDETPYPPPPRLPEKRVPAWQVSQVGLGLEQPETYNRKGPQANIMMNAWAPSMLRLARPTGDNAFRTAARNAVIGRFANYPGYYLDGATTEYQRRDYPVKGPDVTSLYVHHVPPTAAYVLDYLFSDVESRSAGAVSFPSVRQCGYVWFDSRLYGHAPGNVYGETAWPWLHRTAATVDNINVDRVLAEGGGKFHVILLNQTPEPQLVHVTFDGRVLGRDVDGFTVYVHQNNQPVNPLTINVDTAEVTVPGLGLTVLTVEGLKIDVPTHRVMPSDHFALPTESAIHRAPFAGTTLEAVGTEIQVSPFTWRDLYVYVTAAIDDVRTATLRYRVGDGPEQQIVGKEFPWEFTARIENLRAPVTWQVDIETNDGRKLTAKP